jgi:hypothetical protein
MLEGFPDKKTDPVHEVVQEPPGDPSQAVQQVANSEAAPLECADYDLQNYPIAELLRYPEFKVIWRDVRIEIRCVTVVLTLPILQIRWSRIELYAYTRHPKNLGNLVESAIIQCIWEAAVAGAVIGVVMGNFAAALAAFQGIFTQCLEDKFGQFISCMIPGLALIFEVVPADDWHDI